MVNGQTRVDAMAPPQAPKHLRAHLITGAAGSFVLQIGFAGFAFLNAIILARVLGAKGYGAFANAMAWVTLLTIPATFGFGILIVRDSAVYRSQGKWALLKGLLRFADRFVLVLSVLLALAAAGVAGRMFSSSAHAMVRHTIWIALLLLPLLSLANLREAGTRGLEYVIRARLPAMIVRPGLLLAGILITYYFWPNHLSTPTAMAVNVGAGIVTLALSIFFLRKLLPVGAKTATPEYTPRLWLKAAFPMLLYGGAQIALVQTDIVMLGTMRGAHEVGLYAAANRMAYLLTYIIYASETILAPIMSRLYVNGDTEKLQTILTKAVNISFVLSLPLALAFIFWGSHILRIFGSEFTAAATTLIILAVGNILQVALGSGALLLGMVGSEAVLGITFLTIALLNIALNYFLIATYGLNGAAVASMFSLTSAKCFFTIYAARQKKMYTIILGHNLKRVFKGIGRSFESSCHT
jgi:O-antigen/teichoic acid export membrane protein